MFFVVCLFYLNSSFSKNYIWNTILASNSLDPDQIRGFVGTDLGPNCLRKISTDNTLRLSYSQHCI